MIMKYHHSELIELKNQNLNEIAGSTNNLVCQKKQEPLFEERKTSSQSWPCELNEERSFFEINCSLWHSGVRNKLL